MPHLAKSAGFRASAFAASFLMLIGIALTVSPSPAPAASISIVNGKTVNIKDVPWQVAITYRQPPGKHLSPRQRFFCGGSLIAPNLVITAGHCVADLKKSQIRGLEIVSGRTRLNNEAQGRVSSVRGFLMPLRPDGTRRFSDTGEGASWDVALLRLASPIQGETIKLPGEDEAATWAPGQVVTATGWGVTVAEHQRGSAVLHTANQVMLPDSVCKRFNDRGYSASVMNCIGGPSGNSTTCYGDSGGPLVARAGTEVRLVGLTSFGDSACFSYLPSVDTRIGSDPIRTWIRNEALRISGIDVVGSGGTARPLRSWCRMPVLDGLTVRAAKLKLEARGCRLGKVVRQRMPRKRGRVFGATVYPGWLSPLGTRVMLWIGR